MKLSYRDRIILIVVTFIAIIAIFIFAGVRPLSKQIKTNKADAQTQKAAWEEIEEDINRIPKLKKTISSSYDDALTMANYFTPERNTVELDKFIQPYIDACGMTVQSSFDVTDNAVTTLDFYYYTPNILTYPLAEAADLDGSLAADVAEKMKKTLVLSQIDSQSVVGSTVTFDFKASKENILKFADEIKNLDTTVIIQDLTIDDYTFGIASEVPEDIGMSTGSVTLAFYSVQAPTQLNLGD